MKYIKKGVSFLKEPGKSFEKEKKSSLGEAFKYMTILLLVNAVLGAAATSIWTAFAYYALSTAMVATDILFIFIATFAITYAGTLLALVLWGMLLHLCAYLFGARKGFGQTLKAIFYGNTPHYVLGWIPVISFISIIWSFALTGIGIMKLHEMEGAKAAVSLIIALAIAIIAVATASLFLFASLLSFMPSLGMF